jgi:site-specific DNA recombinase
MVETVLQMEVNRMNTDARTVYIYLRASSSKQDKSVPDQRIACHEYAKKNNIKVEAEFSDDGKSAWSGKERKGFNSLLAACKSGGKVKFILVWNLNRFSRQYKQGMIDLLTLEIEGVLLMDTIDGVYDSSNQSQRYKMFSNMSNAEDYSSGISRDVKRGQASMREGGYLHGVAPLGYKRLIVKGGTTWIPDMEHSFKIEEMFNLYDSGMTLTAIADKLNSQGHKPFRSDFFYSTSIGQLLRNPAYGGMQYSKKHGLREAKITTFLDQNLWKRVFDRVQRSDKRTNTTRRMNALTGKVYCGKCGEIAHTVSGSSKVKKYRCRGVRVGACDSKSNLDLVKLELSLTEALKFGLEMYGSVPIMAKAIVDQQYQLDLEQSASVQPLLDRLEQLNKKEANLLDLVEAGHSIKQLSERLERVATEREDLEATLSSMDAGVAHKPIQEAIEEVEWALSNLGGYFRVVADGVSRIDITGAGQCKAVIFGLEFDLDLKEGVINLLTEKPVSKK